MRGGIALTLAALVLALAACSSAQKPAVDPNLAPADYEREILNTLRSTLDNPVNIREASISPPALRPAGQEQRYSVCVRFNARDIRNQYTGVKERIAWFYGGRLNQLIDALSNQCADAGYHPWPALEQLCQARKCE